MSAPSRPPWFAPSSVPPILLLTVVTSFAFNHALISTQRKADLLTHRIHTSLLQDTIDYNSRLLYHLNPPSSSTSFFSFKRSPSPILTAEPEWIQEESESLHRRWKALGLNPRGILASTTPTAEPETQEERPSVGPKQVSWSEIFLGNRETRSTLTDRWQKVTAGIKDSFSSLNLTSAPHPDTDEQQSIQDQEELQQLSQLWSAELQKSS
ncbi:flavin containing amine oxidase [Pseudozyma hubeiensis SY62]|uniref:Flavin containing amine oxidase n=1 Tax=Pseudozyma hubeiensis (strain SY62) TaxID=1305764 RepID=R9P9I0_PSEHS|nr:flavin containing amine oxidase [Pseudozyma hubeiensis SY62]GAC98048.1 flavin containing amine oxidase [Pseudozyma hubeiensis SY62]